MSPGYEGMGGDSPKYQRGDSCDYSAVNFHVLNCSLRFGGRSARRSRGSNPRPATVPCRFNSASPCPVECRTFSDLGVGCSWADYSLISSKGRAPERAIHLYPGAIGVIFRRRQGSLRFCAQFDCAINIRDYDRRYGDEGDHYPGDMARVARVTPNQCRRIERVANYPQPNPWGRIFREEDQ